jgi:ribosomal subunit interface protein
MQVIISGHHLDVGDSFRQYIEEALNKHVMKYFEHAINAHVTLIKEKHHLVTVDIIVNEGTGTGVIIKSTAQDFDPYRSFDQAIAKAEKQLRRYKSKIKRHQKNKDERRAFVEAKSYVLSPFHEHDANDETDAPVIIAEKPHHIEKLTVGDAVMQMDLLDTPALLFINSANNRLNVVYYRKDGNISWVDVPATA